jgi:hypothetical protein
MDITDFKWKDPELFDKIRALRSDGVSESKIYNFIREKKLEKIENFCERLDKKKLSSLSIHERSQSKQNEAAVLSWFELLNTRVSKKQYRMSVDIYRKESKSLWENEEGADVVPYPIELFPQLRDMLIEPKTRGRKPFPINKKRTNIIRQYRGQGYNNRDICKELDRRMIPIPQLWKDELRQKDKEIKRLKWYHAYEEGYNQKIHRLFSKVKSGLLS